MERLHIYGPESPEELEKRLESQFPGLRYFYLNTLLRFFPPREYFASLEEPMRDFPVAAAVVRPPTYGLEGIRGIYIEAIRGNEVKAGNDPTAHAELVAIRQACTQVGSDHLPTGHILVCTHEPCSMCAGAIMAANIETVIFGLPQRSLQGTEQIINGKLKHFKPEPSGYTLRRFLQERNYPAQIEGGYLIADTKRVLDDIYLRQLTKAKF